MTLYALGGQFHEYACQEGDDAMSGILGGARAKEAQAAVPKGGGR